MRTLHLEARLACAAPGDVLVICRGEAAACAHASACGDCLHVQVAPGMNAVELTAQLARHRLRSFWPAHG